MAYDTLILEKEGTTGIITLNRPPVHPFNYPAITNLGKAMDELIKDKDIRVIIITGAGDKAFSAGFDIASFADPMGVWMPRAGHDTYNKIERSPKPVIAAINGFALGGGCELALACHFRCMVDTEKATLGLPEITLGIIPGWGGTQRLPRLVGRTRALEVALLGKKLGAKEAYEWGLLNKVSKPGEVLKDAKEYAAQLGKRAPLALKAILNAMVLGPDTNMYAGIEIELSGSAIVQTSKDAMEGMTAFMEKREAKFTGE
jgi:enoyl-CoA hydratase/carnithine racemase